MVAEAIAAHRKGARVNLRSQMGRIIRCVGLEPWPKLFQNLRATRETELAESFPFTGRLCVDRQLTRNRGKTLFSSHGGAIRANGEHDARFGQGGAQSGPATAHEASQVIAGRDRENQRVSLLR